MKTVQYSLNNQFLCFSIIRPKQLNAINFEVMKDLEELLDIAEDQELKLFAFVGDSGVSLSGGDLKAFEILQSRSEGKAMSERMCSILNRIESLPCLTIAFIQGDVYGGGTETISAFDLIYCTESSKLGFTQSRFGLSPGWGGFTRLKELVGVSTALHWLSVVQVVTAEEALQKGFINGLLATADFNKEIDSIFEKIDKIDIGVITTLKTLSMSALETSRANLFKTEQDMFTTLWASAEHHNRVSTFLNRKDE